MPGSLRAQTDPRPTTSTTSTTSGIELHPGRHSPHTGGLARLAWRAQRASWRRGLGVALVGGWGQPPALRLWAWQ